MEHVEAGPGGDEDVPVGRTVDFGEARLLPDVDRPRAWLLTVDGAPQSYVDLDDPAHLEFEYVRRLASAIDCAFPDGPLDAVHLGGGALTLPRWLAHERPGSRQQVVEADRGLVALVSEYLPWAADGVTAHTTDARAWLTGAPAASADLIVADVFGGARVPAHLTSLEFAREAARVLRPDGLYLANLADAAPFAFLGGQLATVRQAFGGPDAFVCLLAEPGVLRGRRYGNAVLAAARRPLPLDALSRLCAADVFPARVVSGSALDVLTGRPVHDAAAVPSPEPPDGAFTVG
ncbi:spermidine synthase [Actinacidiphila acidipaludis]|uniref:Fused MFS/spermidine synthase n=1 Tax=Actinacidiphila acidipaludis TaxID=2873382 RepID=A0ABS7Q6B0_9ACTN|nr:fused MFS/spermidine synthase [Streptomyces acidipaludis]MBY8878284.1 fused MFS/spermidine synthase [Streptomyces acidipaludis]